jgi:hypothetical protein
MAKISFNYNKFSKSLIKKFNSFSRDNDELQKAGDIIVREIKADSRDGLGYDGEPFPDIKATTKRRRKRLAEFNKTSRFFSPAESNTTFMGDTVKSIRSKAKAGKIELFGKGNHRFIKGVRGKNIKGSNAKTSDILKGLSKLGFKILGVSDRAKKKIAINFRRWIRRNL